MTHTSLRIETERLILRPFTLDDIEPSYQMNLDAEVSKYTGDGGVVSREEMHRRITHDVMGDYQKHGFGRLAVELKSIGQFIGFCGLKYLDDYQEVDLGYRLVRSCWGKGMATEAARACVELGFGPLQLNRMMSMVLPENVGSVKVLEKLGFVFERQVEEEGELADLYVLDKANSH